MPTSEEAVWHSRNDVMDLSHFRGYLSRKEQKLVSRDLAAACFASGRMCNDIAHAAEADVILLDSFQ